MKRPFKHKRRIGPFIEFSDSENSGVLMARKQGNPELRMEISEVNPSIDEDIFQIFNRRAKFDAEDIMIGKEQAQVGTTEPSVTTVQIIAEDEEVNLEDVNHFISVMEKEFTVFNTNISGSVSVDPDKVPDPFEGREFIDDPTEINR